MAQNGPKKGQKRVFFEYSRIIYGWTAYEEVMLEKVKFLILGLKMAQNGPKWPKKVKNGLSLRKSPKVSGSLRKSPKVSESLQKSP